MSKSYFIYNGVVSQKWSCYKTMPINFPTPEKDITRYEVPGRNGDIVIDNKRFRNQEITVNCVIEKDFKALFDAMRADLMATTSYLPFSDSLYPDEYRLAIVKDVIAQTATEGGGAVDIILDVIPQRYLTTGDTGEVMTPTAKSAKMIACGLAEDVLDASFITSNPYVSGMYVTVVDMTSYSGGLTSWDIIANYDPQKLPMQIYFGEFNTNPTNTNGGAKTTTRGYTYTETNTVYSNIFGKYAVFTMPIDWKIVQSGVTLDQLYPDKIKIINPTNYAAKPLLLFRITGAVENYPVCMINGATVYFNLPDDVIIGGESYDVDFVYLDAETSNVYMYPGDIGVPYSLNNYTRIDKDIILKPGDNYIHLNNKIDSVTVTPRWWTI